MAKKPNKPDNYLAARFLGGSMMAVVLIVFGFVLGNMFGQKDGNSRSDDANPQIAKAQPAAAAKPARPAIASTPRKSGQPKYSFYDELQRRSEEVRSENSAKPAPAAKTEKTDNKAEKKPRSPTVKGANYRIQVGAFKDKTQAEQMRKKAALGDLPVEIIYGENKHYLVLIGPYASKDQAIGIQKKLEGQSMQTLLKTFNNAP